VKQQFLVQVLMCLKLSGFCGGLSQKKKNQSNSFFTREIHVEDSDAPFAASLFWRKD